MRVILTVTAAAAIISAPVAGLNAQVISGLVLNAANGEPIADASVVLLDKEGAIKRGYLTEADGLYTLICPKPGTYTLRVGGMGFPPWDSPPMKVAKDQTVDFTVRLFPEGAAGAGLEGFEVRREKGEGVFLTAQEIRKRGGTRFTDVLIGVKSVRLVDLDRRDAPPPTRGETRDERAVETERTGQATAYRTVRLAASHTDQEEAGSRQRGESKAECPPVLFVDGKWWGKIDYVGKNGPDYELLPSELIGIEIYTRSFVPQLFFTGRDSDCGVIVVWTKKGRM